MKMKGKFKSKLLVEGKDDQHVIWNLCEYYTVKECFDVIDCSSINNVFDTLELSVKEEASRYDVIGIVIDADTDLLKRWQRVCDILSEVEVYNLPDSLPNTGLVIEPNADFFPKIGVWIMPNNNLNGMLEDFMATLAAKDDAVLSVVDETLEHLESKGVNKYKTIHKAKARIHTYLAWQEDPGTPMGLAITKKYLDPSAPTSLLFVNWINKLFGDIGA